MSLGTLHVWPSLRQAVSDSCQVPLCAPTSRQDSWVFGAFTIYVVDIGVGSGATLQTATRYSASLESVMPSHEIVQLGLTVGMDVHAGPRRPTQTILCVKCHNDRVVMTSFTITRRVCRWQGGEARQVPYNCFFADRR
jgi:hypothetical protein